MKSSKKKNNATNSTTQWKNWLQLFLLQKQAQGLSERTLSDYRYHIEVFIRRSNLNNESGQHDNDSNDLSILLRQSVLKYFAASGNLSPYTFNTRRKALKPFFNWLVEESIIDANPMSAIRKRKEDDRPKAVAEDILKRLLLLPDLRTFIGLRDYAVFLLTLDTGIRPSEVFGLKVDNFNLKSREILIPADVSKTRVSRTLPMSPITVEAIQKLITNRHPLWEASKVPLFCTEDGRKVISRAWCRRLEYYSSILKVKVRPYDLRHSFAMVYLRAGGDAFSLQRMLGHTNMAMTRKYVNLTDADLINQHSQATPVKRLLQQRIRVGRMI